MHLHGHHAVVLSRDGEPATGSPWWVDSLDVENGETMKVAFVADNPGVWMDHCHNLKHAAEGLVAHLMYSGVTVPYRLGDDTATSPSNPDSSATPSGEKSGKPQTNRCRSPHSGRL